jgi:transmembrane sensor
MNDFFIRYFDSETSPEEQEQIIKKLSEDTAQMQEFKAFAKSWSYAAIQSDSSDMNLEKEYTLFSNRLNHISESSKPAIFNEPVISLRLFYQIAAIGLLLITLGIFGYFYFRPSDQISYNEIITRTGQKAQVTLSDGTKIWLNASSKLRYPSNPKGNEVHVFLQGEAFFDVVHNEKRMFQVHASDLNIKVLGTAFNVKSYPEERIVETTLVRGKVRIEGKNERPEDFVILLPNQKASYLGSSAKLIVTESTNKNVQARSDDIVQVKAIASRSNATIVLSNHVNTLFETSWKDGRLDFADEQFSSLIIKMERWFGVKIAIQDEKLEKVRYTGTFEKETIEQALHALSMSLPFKFDINKDSITIKSK